MTSPPTTPACSSESTTLSDLFFGVTLFGVMFAAHRWLWIAGALVDTPYGVEFWFTEPFRVWLWS